MKFSFGFRSKTVWEVSVFWIEGAVRVVCFIASRCARAVCLNNGLPALCKRRFMHRTLTWSVDKHNFVSFHFILLLLGFSLPINLLFFFSCFTTLLVKGVVSILIIRWRRVTPDIGMLYQELLESTRPLVFLLFDNLVRVVPVVVYIFFQFL